MNVFTSVLEPYQSIRILPWLLVPMEKLKKLGFLTMMMLIMGVDVFSATTEKIENINEVNINIELKNESLLNAFKKIEAASPFHFMYRNEEVKDIQNLSIPARMQSVKSLLDNILANTSLNYKQIDERILISNDEKQSSLVDFPILQVSNLTFPQQSEVSGSVVNSEGIGLPGVSIVVKGTTTGTVSDVEGNYRLVVPGNSEILVFSSIGYITEEININNQNVINVTLIQEVRALTEVVVTAFGLEREKKSLTYATQEVPVEQLSKARELNVVNSLQGRVAGLSITSAGAGVGAEARVVLRGNRSISGDNQPLYVIDGVPTLGSPQDLSPDMIASINVLKGPNAAALYGSAAQNGAIIVETIRGRKGEVQVSLNNTYMVQSPAVPTYFQNEYGQGVNGTYDNRSEEAWGPRLDGNMVDHWSLDPESPAQYFFSANPDNKRDVFQNGYNYASNVIATMGGERTQSIFSYTLTKAAGIVPNNELLRHNASMRVNSQLSKKLRIDSKISFMKQNLENQLNMGPSNYNPIMQIYKMPPNISTSDAMNYDYINEDDGLLRQNFWNPNTTIGANPYWTMDRNLDNSNRTRAILMSSLFYDFTDDLTLMVRGSYDVTNTTVEEKLFSDTYNAAPDGRYDLDKSESSLFNGEFLLSYAKDISENWDFNINVGSSTRMLRDNTLSFTTGKAGLALPNFFSTNNAVLPVSNYNPGYNSDLQSVYAFGQIAWKNAIFLDITGRNDWSSTLPADNQSYFYPSAGLSAVISDLVILPEVFTLLKLRGSWAQVGNSAQPYMLSRSAYFNALGGRNGFLQLDKVLPNPNLRPETTESVEVGFDLRLFKNRLGLDLTAYKTNTIDQLFTIGLPIGSGAASYYTNGGNIENKGLEALLTATPVTTDNITWDVGVNFSLNRNMVLEISDERPQVVVGGDSYIREFVVEEGKPFGEVYAISGWKRDEQGRVLVKANGMPASGEYVRVANFNPDWQGSFFNNLSFKNFNLSFLIEHRQGGSIISMTNAILDGNGLTERTLAGREGGLIFGENLFPEEEAVLEETGEPNKVAINAQTFWRGIGGRNAPVGEAFVVDATNTRLRELTFGYTLPKTMLAGVGITNLNISLVGRNLFFLYRASEGLEPDFLSQGTGTFSEGYQAFAPPTTRSYGVSLKIDF